MKCLDLQESHHLQFQTEKDTNLEFGRFQEETSVYFTKGRIFNLD